MNGEDNKIPLETAIEWTAMWRDKESEYNKYHECNAFLIPLSDLQDLVKEMGNQGPDAKVRGYLGVEQVPSLDPDKPAFQEKLILVGTKKCVDGDTVIYQDLIDGYNPACPPGAKTEDGNGEGGGGIWDFTNPCPPDCDPESPLN